MPELPEVEIASRQLRAWMKGRKIVRAHAIKSRVLRNQSPQKFAALAGHKLDHIDRFGKWMLLAFDGGEGLVSHLGMTGKWIRRKASEPEAQYTKATLELDDGHALDYRDPRLFGLLTRDKTDALRKLPTIAGLGPDPLGGIDVERLHERFLRTARSFKEVLMDQATLAGLGNIQVSESLHRARLDPQRPGRTLTAKEAGVLAKSIDASLRATLDAEDSAEPITYVEEGGENTFLVYDRAGLPCYRCKTRIERIVQGGRSTFFCPSCQASGRSAGRKKADGKRSAGKGAAARR